MSETAGPRLLLVGGSGGLVGRHLLPELMDRYRIRSIHRTPLPTEARAGVEWIPGDIGRVENWPAVLQGVDVLINVAWHRWGNRTRFRRLEAGLERLVSAAASAGVRRFVHLSVPSAPEDLERGLPYLYYKRRLDRILSESGLSYRILRPTMLFGRGDRLLGVMMRLMHRYPFFPMFGDGSYHVSPVAATDLAVIVRSELEGTSTGTIDIGGPERFRYRDLTDEMYRLLGKRPRYVRLGARGSVALGQLVQDLGSTLLYAYEVEWLMSDRLGLEPYGGLDHPMVSVRTYLAQEAARLTGGPGSPGLPASAPRA